MGDVGNVGPLASEVPDAHRTACGKREAWADSVEMYGVPNVSYEHLCSVCCKRAAHYLALEHEARRKGRETGTKPGE